MSVTAYPTISTKVSPDGRGLVFHAYQQIVGDNSGGNVICNFGFLPWRETWWMLDRWVVSSNNANTDQGQIVTVTNAFEALIGWQTQIEADALTKLIPGGGFALNTPSARPQYLGRLVAPVGNNGACISGVITPNTNTKTYNFEIMGRVFFFDPGLDIWRL